MKFYKYIYFFLFISLLQVNLFANGSIGTSGADFLELGIGSRALSLGSAFTAEIDDVNSIYFNPGASASLKYPSLSINHRELLLDSRLENLSLVYPIKNHYIGFSNTMFWVPPFEKIDINGNNAGNVTYFNGYTTIAYGYSFGFIYLGGSFKYIYQRIDTLFLHGIAFDFGVLLSIHMFSPFDAPLKNLQIGLSFLNLGLIFNSDYPLPRQLRLGVAYKLLNWLKFNIDMVQGMIDVSDFYDFTYGFDESFQLNLGVEFSYENMLFFRAGYRFNDGGTYTLGLGFNYAIKNVSFMIDASFEDSGDFGPNYSFNLSFKLIPKVITQRDIKEAEIHYKKGIKYFILNDIESALREFKKCRDYDPYHKNVTRKIDDLEELLRLKKENEDLDEKLKKEKRDKKTKDNR